MSSTSFFHAFLITQERLVLTGAVVEMATTMMPGMASLFYKMTWRFFDKYEGQNNTELLSTKILIGINICQERCVFLYSGLVQEQMILSNCEYTENMAEVFWQLGWSIWSRLPMGVMNTEVFLKAFFFYKNRVRTTTATCKLF